MLLGITAASLTARRQHLTERACGFCSLPEQMGVLVVCNMDGFVDGSNSRWEGLEFMESDSKVACHKDT